ncbi:peptidase d [Cystoisospora suis]|uniref:Xaa-Pro dipeptidase n=1 Tax=Cystoisospora suis TaxID=483139 RepID=A0A2C6JZJ6_9APIC|nr:peptidase d [Cystoisospora suis]
MPTPTPCSAVSELQSKMAAPVSFSAYGCQQRAENGILPSVLPPFKFSSPDDTPPSLPQVLQEILHPSRSARQSPSCSTSGKGESKPWLHWPVSFDAVRQSDPQRQLHAYLTSRKALAARTHQVRERVFKAAEAAGLMSGDATAAFFQGGTSDDWSFYSSDCNKTVFRQEQFFHYLFGVNEPDLYGLLDLKRREAILFFPWTSPDYQRFMGPLQQPENYVQAYGIEKAVVYKADMAEIKRELKASDRGITRVLVLRGQNSDSDRLLTPPAITGELGISHVDDSVLYDLLVECRVHKTPLEQDHLRAACLLSSQAHVFVMQHVREGMVEGQAEALFKAFAHYAGGARHVAYDCICCAGPHGAILHYGHAGRPNDGVIKSADMLLFDMGGEYAGYSTDITVSFPVSGCFTPEQRTVYEAVLRAQQAVEASMRPGVSWCDMHRLAEKTILERLIEAGVLKGPIEACMDAQLGSVFMPHGLGHLLGVDTHDVGGFTKGFPRREEPGLRYLRTTRVLEEDMVITVEPGCYFVPFLIDKALNDEKQKSLINEEKLSAYLNFGGVRLEDVVLLTRDGILNFTVVPRLIEDVEALLSREGCEHTT